MATDFLLQLPEPFSFDKPKSWSKWKRHFQQYRQEYIIEGEYPTSLWACVTTLDGVHDLCIDIHMLEASMLAVCGHVAEPQVQ